MRRHLAAALLAVGAGAAGAQETDMIAGSYLLHQSDGYFRILVLAPDGSASQLSDQERLLGFTTGQGTWSAQGDGAAVARIIDFTFDRDSGEPTGPGVLTYELGFADAADGSYQTVTGSYAGLDYPHGTDPLAPDVEPARSFGIDFTGRRIPAP